MFEIKWGKRCFFWELKWLTKRDYVLLTIIWNHRKWHVHRNPKKRTMEIIGKGAAEILDKVGTYPTAGE